jgi:hypothetical protein
MKTIALPVVVFLACVACAVAAEQTNELPGKELIWQLIPKSCDGPFGAQAEQNIKRAIAIGPAVLPVLAELLREQAGDESNAAPLMVSRIIVMAQQVKGDQEPIRVVLRDLLRHPDVYVRKYAVQGLAEMGTGADCAFLLPVLRDPSEVIRVNAALALGRIGDEDVAARIAEILAQRKTGMSPDEIRKDYSFAHGYQAISNIVSRKHGSGIDTGISESR